jgi:hypothetical protein
MRRAGALFVGLLLSLGGCAVFEEPAQHSTSFFDQLRPGHEPEHQDLIALEFAIVQRPIYDDYVDKELWEMVDERVGSLISRAALHANGFRVGTLGGIPPAEFMRMLTSDRNCNTPRSISLHSGGSTKLQLGPVCDSSRFDLIHETDIHSYALDRVQHELMVTPTLNSEGGTCLKCTPQARHGEEITTFQPAPGGWLPHQEQQLQTFLDQAWEINVPQNQFVVIGGRADMPDTLGYQTFVRPTDTPPVRYLLVIRPVRAAPGLAPVHPLKPGEQRSPVLAIQAAQSGLEPAEPGGTH